MVRPETCVCVCVCVCGRASAQTTASLTTSADSADLADLQVGVPFAHGQKKEVVEARYKDLVC